MSGCRRRWAPSAPGGSPRLGAFPRSRRAWVLGRVIASTAAGMVLTSGLLAGLWLLHVGTGVVAAPTSIDAMNTLGLVLLAFLLAAAFVAAGALWVAAGTRPLGGGPGSPAWSRHPA